MKFKMGILLGALLLLIFTFDIVRVEAASAEDQAVGDLFGGVLYGIPNFRFPSPQYVGTEVNIGRGNSSFAGSSLSEFDRWLEIAHSRQLAFEGKSRNIRVIKGEPLSGQLRLSIEMRVVSGRELQESSSAERSYYTRSSRSSYSEDERVYLTLQPTLEKKVGKNSWEIVAAPAGQISISESRQTAAGESRSFQIDHWQCYGGRWSRSENDSWSWESSREIAREMMLDNLSNQLARRVIALVLREWWRDYQLQQYGKVLDRDKGKDADPSTYTPDNISSSKSASSQRILVMSVDKKAGRVTVDPGDQQLKEGMILVPREFGKSRLRVVYLFPRPRDGGSRYAVCEPVRDADKETVYPKEWEEYQTLPL